jgi:hypothetical protein
VQTKYPVIAKFGQAIAGKSYIYWTKVSWLRRVGLFIPPRHLKASITKFGLIHSILQSEKKAQQCDKISTYQNTEY